MAGLSSFGTLFEMGDGGSPENFTTIADVHDISGPTLSAATEDVTSHSSPNGWSEYITTIKDAGEVTFSIHYQPTAATHNVTTGVLADLKNGTLRNYKLVFTDPSHTTWSFSGYVIKFEPKAPVKGKLTADLGFRLTGQPLLA